MAIHAKAVVIGLTAPFGSGSTTSAEILSARLQFKSVLLSSYIRRAFEQANPGTAASRSDLQMMGDYMRMNSGAGILAESAVEALEADRGTGQANCKRWHQERLGNRLPPRALW